MRNRIVALILFVLPIGLSAQGLPDLIVDPAELAHKWVVREEFLDASFCSVIEGGITPGDRFLVRFTVSTPNIGTADLAVGDPNERVNDGLFEFASCHNHFHFNNYALYQLVDPNTGFIWRAAKHGFCMIDIQRYQGFEGKAGRRRFDRCGAIGIPGNQGISVGWTDIYIWKLAGQYFILDGGDGQPPVPPGDYLLRVTVNPPFTPQKKEVCPTKDPQGFCHMFAESDYSNNAAQVTVTVPADKKAVGPLRDEPPVTEEIID